MRVVKYKYGGYHAAQTIFESQMPRPSPFEQRQSASPEKRKLSDNPTTVRTREYECSQTGLKAAYRKADTAASVARSRARNALQQSTGWGAMSAEEQGNAVQAAEATINRKRDEKKKTLASMWKGMRGNFRDEVFGDMDLDDEDMAMEGRLAALDEEKRETAEGIKGLIGPNKGRLTACLEILEANGSYDESPCNTDLSSDEHEEDEEEWEDEEADEDLEADEVDSE